MLVGELVYLSALEPSNAEQVRAWINDPETHHYLLSGRIPLTAASEAAWYERVERTDDAHIFEIHVTEDGRLIGHIGLESVDLVHRSASLGIVIGEASARGRGYGFDAIVTLLRFAFDTLGLHSVSLTCRVDNERGERLYRRVGFAEIGRERESFFGDGEFHDCYLFDLLDREFRARYPAPAGS